jgi:molybdate transport system substrate-binding protein
MRFAPYSFRSTRSTLRRARFAVCRVLLGLAALLPLGAAADVTVFAAASLKEAMDEAGRAFTAASGNKVSVAYGASNALAKQIEAGAPADVFISADLDWMDHLDRRKLLQPGSRTNLLTNTLVLVAPASSTTTLKIGPGFALAAALGNDRLALANPDSVPAGKYAKAALQKLGVWTSVERRTARTDNVRAALALVARGETPFGIVYRTDALADKGVRIVDSFPAGTHPDIVYPAAIVAGARSPAAAALLDFLRSAAMRATLTRHGFGAGPAP